MTEWKIQDNRVFGKGQSYTCHNKITAQELHKTLTHYETIKQQYENEEKIDKIHKKIIQIQMTQKILDEEINQLKEIATQ